MKKNLFIALEGIDGSGKSTQVKLLSEYLIKEGQKVHVTAEPTGGPIGKMIRDIFNHRMTADHRTIAALFVADRLEHLTNDQDGLLKKLEEGHVVTDRYYFSSYAYHGTHMDMQWVIEANSICAKLLRPDLTVFIDISPGEAMNRLNIHRQSKEMYESLENLENVRKKYFEAFELLKDREKIVIVDGNRSPELISADIIGKVAALAAESKTIL